MINDTISTADADELKILRQVWYDAVYSSLEKLDKRIDIVSENILIIKNELKNDIVLCKQRLVEDFDSFGKSELRLTLSLKTISDRLNSLEDSSIRDELRAAIKEVGHEVDTAKDVLGKRREACLTEFTKIKERLATIETKIWMFAGITGVASSVMTTLLIYLVKVYILN